MDGSVVEAGPSYTPEEKMENICKNTSNLNTKKTTIKDKTRRHLYHSQPGWQKPFIQAQEAFPLDSLNQAVG